MSNDPVTTKISEHLSPILLASGFELVDVAMAAGTCQVLVELADSHPNFDVLGGRIDLDNVAVATLVVNDVIDSLDPISSAFTLEVSSPGLERPLRTPKHFVRFVGQTVSLKCKPGSLGERRHEGVLESADDDEAGSICVGGREISYSDIERARTVFVWGGQPKTATTKGTKAKQSDSKNRPGKREIATSQTSGSASLRPDHTDGGVKVGSASDESQSGPDLSPVLQMNIPDLGPALQINSEQQGAAL